MSRYIALIDGEPGAFGVSFPDLPGCTAMGSTVDEAIDNAAEALRDWVEAVEAGGAEVPAPRPAATLLLSDPDLAPALAEGGMLSTVVLVRGLGRPVKANLSLDSGVLAAIDAAADRLRITRSAMVEQLARTGLQHVS